ncbi:hypothetical protein [Lactobacillus gasseri]|uniref:hypothetical protein n=1 Tax=Lactobacillus gasseri TaxID=1596 RepID=UPI001BFF11FF|nr:hypothetical protein [Lactobacillus gasseri]
MRNLRFKKEDFQFIKEKYPDLYLKFKNPHEDTDVVNIPMRNDTEYEYYYDIVGDYIADSLDEAGELSEDGLRLESAWDYADWTGN